MSDTQEPQAEATPVMPRLFTIPRIGDVTGLSNDELLLAEGRQYKLRCELAGATDAAEKDWDRIVGEMRRRTPSL